MLKTYSMEVSPASFSTSGTFSSCVFRPVFRQHAVLPACEKHTIGTGQRSDVQRQQPLVFRKNFLPPTVYDKLISRIFPGSR